MKKKKTEKTKGSESLPLITAYEKMFDIVKQYAVENQSEYVMFTDMDQENPIVQQIGEAFRAHGMDPEKFGFRLDSGSFGSNPKKNHAVEDLSSDLVMKLDHVHVKQKFVECKKEK